MKAIRLLLVSFFVLCASTTNVVASKESDRAKIQRAMKAAPSSISAHATILDADGTVLRKGSDDGKWVCFPGVPLIDGDKHPMCNDKVWMTWLAAIISGAIFEESYPGPSTVGYSYMLIGDALVNNGGEDPIMDQEGPHLMMLFPKSVDISHLPQSPNAGGPYVMWANTPLIHVMVPITDRDR